PEYASIKIIIISLYHHKHLVLELLKYGVKGFVTKNIEAEELVNAISLVYNNQFYIESGIISNPDTSIKNQNEIQNDFILSEQQKQILKLCCQDYTYKEIAEIMNIGIRTVHDHRDRLCEKLNINTRIGLIIYAIQIGIVNVWE
ncbi:MAG TPA: response regulator transcription factor, partial [Chitinophagaceae bacterium]|nr:response regulator transcription factor [Chitinophagaceae bacterium]